MPHNALLLNSMTHSVDESMILTEYYLEFRSKVAFWECCLLTYLTWWTVRQKEDVLTIVTMAHHTILSVMFGHSLCVLFNIPS